MERSRLEKEEEHKKYNRENPALSIHNVDSGLVALYHMKTPFLVTLEFCSGTGSEDYINILTLSNREAFYQQETASEHHDFFIHNAAHMHDYFELMIVLEGCVIQKIGEQEYQYYAGNCCLVNRSLAHKEDFCTQAKVVFLGLSVEFVSELFDVGEKVLFGKEAGISESDICRFILDDLKAPGQKAYLDFIPAMQNESFPKYLHDLTNELLEVLFQPAFGATWMLKGLISGIIAYLSSTEHYHCTYVTLDSASEFLLFSRITHLLEESSGRAGRTELGQTLNYSGDYINRIVHKYTGLCLYDYGMTICLKRAANELLYSRDSISTIAARLHFTNRTHFYTLFKKQYGMTPKEYRTKGGGTAVLRQTDGSSTVENGG